jgi:hypothetical protein
MKLKMAATAELSLTLDPMGKCFKMLLLWNHLDSWNLTAQERSLEGPLQIYVFFVIRKSKMAATAGPIVQVVSEKKGFETFFP